MKIKFLLLITILSAPLSVFANGGTSSVGGGGDVVILPNDSVVLADSFLNHQAAQPDARGLAVKMLNPRLRQAIQNYRKSIESVLWAVSERGANSDILHELGLLERVDSSLQFVMVSSAEDFKGLCDSGGVKSYKLSVGAAAHQVACTEGKKTYIVESLFAQLNMRDQILLLIHERLTTLRDRYGGKNYSAVARFTTGFALYLNLYKEQSSGTLSKLSGEQTNILTEFYLAIEELEKRDSEVTDKDFAWEAHGFGGGLKKLSANVALDAYLSIDSRAEATVVVMSGAKVFTTYLKTGSSIGRNALVKNLRVMPLKVLSKEVGNVLVRMSPVLITAGESAVLEDLDIFSYSVMDEVNIKIVFNVGEFSVIKNSKLYAKGRYFGDGFLDIQVAANSRIDTIATQYAGELRFGSDSKILKTYFIGEFFSFANFTTIENSTLRFSYRALNIHREHQVLKDGTLNDASYDYAPKGYKFKTVNSISFNQEDFSLFTKDKLGSWQSEGAGSVNCSPREDDGSSCAMSFTVNKKLMRDYFVRSIRWRFSFKLNENQSPNYYTIHDGAIYVAGTQYRFYLQHPANYASYPRSFHDGYEKGLEKLSSELQKQGVACKSGLCELQLLQN